MMNVLNIHMLRSFDINTKNLGIISSSYFFASLLSLLPAGILLDRFSTRTLILSAMSTTVLSTYLFALAPSSVIALTARFIAGLSGAFCFISSLRLATRWFPPEKLARVTGAVVALGMIGAIISQAPLSILIDQIGWRQTTLIVATIGSCLIYVVYKTVEDYPADQPYTSSPKHRTNNWYNLKTALTNVQNWLTGLYISLMNLPLFILGALWGSLYLTQAYSLNNTQAGEITSMVFVGMIFGSPCMGWVSDRLKNRQLPMIFFAVMILIPLISLIVITHQNFYTLLLTFFMIGFFCSAHIIGYSLIAECNSRSITATAEGLASTLMLAGGLAQTPFAWILHSRWSGKITNGVAVYSVSDFNRAIMMVVIAAVVAIVIALTLKETHGKQYQDS